jgi:endoglycosylceramidase
MRKIIILTAFLLSGCFPYHPGNSSKNAYITDTYGRICIYHGVNVANCSKSTTGYLPWHTKDDFSRLNTWGFNLVRFLVFWDAIEPSMDSTNFDYLRGVAQRIQWLKELGIDAVIDLHQDLFSKKYTGDGFPGWTIRDDGKAFTPQQPWNKNYLQPAVLACFNNFWKNDTLKQAYLSNIKRVVQYFDTFPNVIGIDVMNEPFPGTDLKFEQTSLTILYDSALAILKSTRLKMFFEPVMYTSTGIPTLLKFKPDSHCVYYPHYYDPLCDGGRPYKWANRRLLKQSFMIRLSEAQKFNVPMLYGEWGVIRKLIGAKDYMTDFTDACDSYSVGWTYYSYDMADDGGFSFINPDKTEASNLKYLSLVYPQKIAGKNPVYGTAGEVFTLHYETKKIVAPTVIFVPGDFSKYKVTINGQPYICKSNRIEYVNDTCSTQMITIK